MLFERDLLVCYWVFIEIVIIEEYNILWVEIIFMFWVMINFILIGMEMYKFFLLSGNKVFKNIWFWWLFYFGGVLGIIWIGGCYVFLVD